MRHSEAVSAKHYDFGAVESSARHRQIIVNLIGATASVDIETESNSTIEPDSESTLLTDVQTTKRLFDQVKSQRPVTVTGKLPTLDDVRAVIATDYKDADEIWQVSAPKKVTSRSVFYSCIATDSFFHYVIMSNYFCNVVTAAFPLT